MNKSDSPESRQEHEERMKRWGKETLLAKEQGRLTPYHLMPKIVSTQPSSIKPLRRGKWNMLKGKLIKDIIGNKHKM